MKNKRNTAKLATSSPEHRPFPPINYFNLALVFKSANHDEQMMSVGKVKSSLDHMLCFVFCGVLLYYF